MIHGEMQDFALTLDKFLTHAAKWHPDRGVATAAKRGEVFRATYADLEQTSREISARLQQIGIQTGDRVATLAWNTRHHLDAWFGIIGMGAVCHTLNPRLPAEQSSDMLRQSEARILFIDPDLLKLGIEIASTSPSLEHVFILDSEGIEGVQLKTISELVPEVGPLPEWGDFPENSPSGLCFTSGTTGAPKGVTYTHRSGYLHTMRALQKDVMEFSQSDSILMAVPMFHANAWGIPFAAPAVGAQLVLPGRHLDGASLAALIESEQVTVGVGVPTVWLGLSEHYAKTGDRPTSLKRIIMGGAPLPQALMAALEDQFDVRIQSSWGMTELSPLGTIVPLSENQRTSRVSGRPAIGVDLMLKDETGQDLDQQRDQEGHLYVRGPAVVERYFGADAPATTQDGWFPTGDLARIERDGQLVITGRSKDLIKSGGEWINPAEIEAVVNALPGVAMAAVIGRADDKWGERPLLLVETRHGQTVSDDDLFLPIRAKVASWWVPDQVIRIPAMPLAPTGKIDKLRLVAEYGGG